MKFILVIVATLLLGSSAQAQVRKCTGPDGKVTYSDFLCGGRTASESSVKTDANTIDSSGLREESQKNKSAQAVEQAIQQGASKCKFSYYAVGDSKGKELAAAAKQECLNNITAKATGQPTSLEAYNFWKDHSTQKSSDRQNAINRASAATNAQATANSTSAAIDAAARQNRSFKCKPSLFERALDCK